MSARSQQRADLKVGPYKKPPSSGGRFYFTPAQ